MPHVERTRLRPGLTCLLVAALLTTASCEGPARVEDPVSTLNTAQQSPRLYRAAIEQIRARGDGLTADELQALRSMMHRPGYVVAAREDALELLAERDMQALHETIDFRLARLDALEWRRRLCEIIAEREWRELSPALVRGLAYPIYGWVRSIDERPEYLALARLHGRDGIVDAVFEIFLSSRAVALQGLRRSCWNLLIEFGQRDRLARLLREGDFPEDDLMLRDLRIAAIDLGILPLNHEEIIWLRALRDPSREAFWADAKRVVSALPPARRAEFELRDLAILITASHHEPELIHRTRDDLYQEVESRLRGARHHPRGADMPGPGTTARERLRDHRDRIVWGDLAAILLALRAMEVPQVVSHLFDYAEQDRLDESTEYGGVIRLDERNRFEVLEFPPRVRYGDHRFEASQEMFNAGYTSVFHFHFHAQRYNNARYAGPGDGDYAYADNTRANCLVLTFIDADTLNVDYYRHGRVVVDLGVIRRPR